MTTEARGQRPGNGGLSFLSDFGRSQVKFPVAVKEKPRLLKIMIDDVTLWSKLEST